ncbi:MAG TPA: NYN domain-containing protein [Longimicrobiaceae bacterium]
MHAPNAALLIDFDNVTVGIRSDLGKELKALLNSDIIRGKVAVQRAYADWRRYPQYIVPLTEASVDLIFAPAYGTSKKNATDLRMAVDAIELVFTRPEIGTFILLTGDSDFSSCVLKLKEYGKYVIGVGMRESSSDLLIQNCDEYYSYHSLSGLTRASVGGQSMSEDPWMLVAQAARQMVKDRDAMRPDRLKQVMLTLDPGFDEKKLGYSKFSRFVIDAANKGLIRLKRGHDGQHEIALSDDDGTTPTAEAAAPSVREAAEPRYEDRPRDDRPRDRDRGRDRGRNGRRGGRDRDRDRRPDSPPPPAVMVETPDHGPAEPEVVGVLEQVKGAEPALAPVSSLDGAYSLLQHAARSLVGRGGAARDADVKRRMLEMAPGFDETGLGFSKFSRFLRQAHDAEAIDLRRNDDGSYEVALPASGKRLPEPDLRGAEGAPAAYAEPAQADEAAASPVAEAAGAPAEAAPSRGGRGRGRGRRGAPEGVPPILPGQLAGAGAAAGDEAPSAGEPAAAGPVAEALGEVQEPAAAPAAAAEETAPRAGRVEAGAPAPAEAADTAAGGRVSLRGRRGSRGRPGAEGPPPLLPGQAVPSSRAAAEPQPEAPAAEAAPPAAEEVLALPAAGETTETVDEATQPQEETAAEAPRKRGRSRGRGRGGRRGEGAEPETAEASAADEAPAPAEEPAAPAAPPAFSAGALGLPTGAAEIQEYLGSYKGVGKKTVQSLTEAVGDDVFRVLEEDPDRVRQALGDRRANALLEQWAADRDRRREERAAEAPAAPEPEAAPAPGAQEATLGLPDEDGAEGFEAAESGDAGDAGEGGAAARKRRGRRGGRGRGRKNGNGADAAAEVPAGEEPAPEPPVAAPPAPEASAPEGGDEGDAGEGDDAGDPAEGGEAARKRRGRRGGRGRSRKKDTPAAE